ncbi:hypothetical protein [Flavobacterium sp. GSP6]|uniref:hypothetical protein n=1 Tax=Flavobacterium sp. GSP6 TaxID=2497488 RepID=UPI000F85EAA8|nr:hypothetical protein [Flavobacterium sp. GSP6]RTZ02105.1 hypothetical protein EKM03_14525 [Flavobacterium sp. GSP6]
MQFRYNPISEPIDTIPENSLEAKPPMIFDYFYASIELGDKLNTQVKTIVKFSDGKVFERFEEFLIDENDLELCITQSMQNYFLKFGLSEEKVLSLFEKFEFNSAKTMPYNYR